MITVKKTILAYNQKSVILCRVIIKRTTLFLFSAPAKQTRVIVVYDTREGGIRHAGAKGQESYACPKQAVTNHHYGISIQRDGIARTRKRFDAVLIAVFDTLACVLKKHHHRKHQPAMVLTCNLAHVYILDAVVCVVTAQAYYFLGLSAFGKKAEPRLFQCTFAYGCESGHLDLCAKMYIILAEV
jgi:hypothetical protein